MFVILHKNKFSTIANTKLSTRELPNNYNYYLFHSLHSLQFGK